MHQPTPIHKVLIISYAAGQDSSAASIHVDDRLPELTNQEIEYELISSVLGKKFTKFRHFRVFSGLFSGLRYEIRHYLRQKLSHSHLRKIAQTLILLPIIPLYLVEKLFIRLDATWSWFITATPLAVVRCWRFQPKVMYVTGGPASAHMAAMIASRITGIPFVSEFQDPLTNHLNPRKRMDVKYKHWLERTLVKHAKKIIYLTQNAKKATQLRYPKYSDKISHIYPGLLPINLPSTPNQHNQTVIAHFGSLAGSRNLDTLLSILEKHSLTINIVIKLYGHVHHKIVEHIQASPAKHLIKLMGKVSRDEALKSMAKSDILLLIQNSNDVSIDTIPSKVYEYMQTGKPILGLTYKNNELDNLLTKYGHIAVDLRNSEHTVINMLSTPLDELYSAIKPYTYGVTDSVTLLLSQLFDSEQLL